MVRRSAFLIACLLAPLAAAQQGPAEEPRTLAMLRLSANAAAAEQAPAVSSLLASVLASTALRVITQDDLTTLLGLERERALLGDGECADTHCMVELSGAVGARYVLASRLDRLGERFLLTTSLFDAQQGLALAKPSVEVAREELLPRGVREVAAGLRAALGVEPQTASGPVASAPRLQVGLKAAGRFLVGLASLSPAGDVELAYLFDGGWAGFLQVGFAYVRTGESVGTGQVSLVPSVLGVRRSYREAQRVQPYWGLGVGIQLAFGTYGLFQNTGPLPTVLGMGGVEWAFAPGWGLALEATTNLAEGVLGLFGGGLGGGLNVDLGFGVRYRF